jgi:hypothetical protein
MKRFVVVALIGACSSSSSPAGDPLISGAITASYDGHPFTPTFGFATLYQGFALVGFGDSAVHCGSEKPSNPPAGSGVIASFASLDVGSYPSTPFEIFRNDGHFNAVESPGDLEITAVTPDSVSGSIAYAYTDSANSMYSASGTFEVLHCP